MSMPFYVAPEQVMKDRADYARKGIARGRSLIAVVAEQGIVIVAENPSTTLRFYARWIPTEGRHWVDVLDASGTRVEPRSGTKRVIPSPRVTQDLDFGWSRRRDLNPRPADYESRAGDEPALSRFAHFRVTR